MRRVTPTSLLCWLLSFILLTSLGGCSTITSSDVYNEDLQGEIRNEQLIKIGDYAIIHTLDNVKYEFVVDSIDEERIEGEGFSIQIDDIAALKIKALDIEKTVGLTALTGVGLYFLYLGALLASFGLLF